VSLSPVYVLPSTLTDAIRFNKQNAVLEMSPERAGQELLEDSLFAPSVDSAEYHDAKEEMRYLAGPRGLDAVLDGYDLDAIMVIGHGKHSLAAMAGAPTGKLLHSTI
jgi:amidase